MHIKDIVQPDLIKSPWYINFIYAFGIPAVIAASLVYLLAVRVDTAIINIKENLSLHATDTAYIVKQNERMEQLMQQICANTANSVEARNDCFRRR